MDGRITIWATFSWMGAHRKSPCPWPTNTNKWNHRKQKKRPTASDLRTCHTNGVNPPNAGVSSQLHTAQQYFSTSGISFGPLDPWSQHGQWELISRWHMTSEERKILITKILQESGRRLRVNPSWWSVSTKTFTTLQFPPDHITHTFASNLHLRCWCI